MKRQLGYYFKNCIIIWLCFFYGQGVFSQIDATHLLDFYYGLGSSVPIGAFSNNSGKQHALGKAGPGLNMKIGGQYVHHSKYAFSLELDYGIYTATNDELYNEVRRRVSTYSKNQLGGEFKEIDVNISQVAVGSAMVFNFKKLIVFPKIALVRGRFGYDYMASYLLYDEDSLFSGQGQMPTSVEFLFNDYNFISFKPELKVAYILSRRKHTDLALSIGASYFFVNPRLTLFERRNSKVTEVLTLRDQVHAINIFCSIHLMFKRKNNFQNKL